MARLSAPASVPLQSSDDVVGEPPRDPPAEVELEAARGPTRQLATLLAEQAGVSTSEEHFSVLDELSCRLGILDVGRPALAPHEPDHRFTNCRVRLEIPAGSSGRWMA